MLLLHVLKLLLASGNGVFVLILFLCVCVCVAFSVAFEYIFGCLVELRTMCLMPIQFNCLYCLSQNCGKFSSKPGYLPTSQKMVSVRQCAEKFLDNESNHYSRKQRVSELLNSLNGEEFMDLV